MNSHQICKFKQSGLQVRIQRIHHVKVARVKNVIGNFLKAVSYESKVLYTCSKEIDETTYCLKAYASCRRSQKRTPAPA